MQEFVLEFTFDFIYGFLEELIGPISESSKFFLEFLTWILQEFILGIVQEFLLGIV